MLREKHDCLIRRPSYCPCYDNMLSACFNLIMLVYWLELVLKYNGSQELRVPISPCPVGIFGVFKKKCSI